MEELNYDKKGSTTIFRYQFNEWDTLELISDNCIKSQGKPP